MFHNYIATALNNLLKNKLFSVINIVGLAVALTSCILITLFVVHELGFDQYHEKAARIYRVSRDYTPVEGNNFELHLATNAPQAAELLQADYPAIASSARLRRMGFFVAYGNQSYYDKNIWADSTVFDLFDFDWLQGQPSTALEEPYTVVLTESIAQKYFGDDDALGQTLMVENRWPVRVTGVIADLPDNTHLDFDILGSLSSLSAMFGDGFLEGWGNNNFYTYVLLDDPAAAQTIEDQSAAFLARHMDTANSLATAFSLTALPDIHLHSQRELEMAPGGNPATVYGLAAIAFFILAIACINFINLTTARASQRLNEIAIRKTVGAARAQITWQFLSESGIYVALAMVLTIALVEFVLPVFNALAGTALVFDYLAGVPLMALLALFVGAIAGGYPALYLSGFKPLAVQHGGRQDGKGNARFRSLLVIVQFAISIALIVATLVIFLQLRHANTLALGFQKDRIVVLSGNSAGAGSNWNVMKQRLLDHPGVAAVTASNLTPGTQNLNARDVRIAGQSAADAFGVAYLNVDFDFFKTYGMALVAGRAFDQNLASDQMVLPGDDSPGSAAFVINESMARQLGFMPAQAIGERLDMSLDSNFATFAGGSIVGVVKDAHLESARAVIQPLVFVMPPAEEYFQLQEISIKLSGDEIPATLAYIDQVWTEAMPGIPVSRRFLDQDFTNLYRAEEKQGQVLSGFSVLAIIMSSLGLYGLASSTATRRIREIAVRKVMGGSVWSIVLLLTNDFSRLVLLANLIAWPLAWLAMSRWLEHFAYRIDLTPIIFIGSGSIAFCIAWVTVGTIAAKSANAHPVLMLRYE